MTAADISDLAALAYMLAFGFVLGRGAPAKAKPENLPAIAADPSDDELLRELGRGVYSHCYSVWFDMRIVGSGFIITRERKLKVTGKPTLSITISGDTDQ
jgi:hypothetical protein